MKTTFTFLLLFFSISFTQAQYSTVGIDADTPIVSPDSAIYHEGSLTIVCGKITGTHVGKSGVMKLNFGREYPDHTFSVTIFSEHVSKFKSAEEYEGKDVCVTGRVVLYKGKAEIVLKSPNQLREQ